MIQRSIIKTNYNENILYSDEYVELTANYLSIKKFFFPTLKAKYLRVNEIKVVYFEKQKDAEYALRRIWGTERENNIYWAADFSRCLPGKKHNKTDVVIDIEDGVRKGFTVQDAETFLATLRILAPISLIIVDNLKF